MQKLKLFNEVRWHLRKLKAIENEYIFLKIKQTALLKTLGRVPDYHEGTPINQNDKQNYTNFRAKQIVELVDTHKEHLSKKINKFLSSSEQLQYDDELSEEQYSGSVANFIDKASEEMYEKSF